MLQLWFLVFFVFPCLSCLLYVVLYLKSAVEKLYRMRINMLKPFCFFYSLVEIFFQRVVLLITAGFLQLAFVSSHHVFQIFNLISVIEYVSNFRTDMQSYLSLIKLSSYHLQGHSLLRLFWRLLLFQLLNVGVCCPKFRSFFFNKTRDSWLESISRSTGPK